VSQVLHESFFKVDEHGAEGAAATAVLMERMAVFGAKPKVLAADRPFVFAIVHRESGAPLFLGVMGEPKG
jgi:serpin B